MTPRPRTSPGFTLMELVISLTLIAIIASVAILSVDPYRSHSVDSIGRIIAADLQLARSMAIEHDAPWSVQFDLENNSYTFVYAGDNTPPTVSHPQYPGTPLHGYRVDLNRLIGTKLHQTTCKLSSVRLRSTGLQVEQVTFGPLGGTGPAVHQDTLVMLTAGSGGTQSQCELTVSWVTGHTWLNLDGSTETHNTNAATNSRSGTRRGRGSRRGSRWGR